MCSRRFCIAYCSGSSLGPVPKSRTVRPWLADHPQVLNRILAEIGKGTLARDRVVEVIVVTGEPVTDCPHVTLSNTSGTFLNGKCKPSDPRARTVRECAET